MLTSDFSEYLVFVDESGSPSMGGHIDPQYPLFVLAFLIVKKVDYIYGVSPAIQAFKLKYYGHDQVILHEREIRKDQGAFKFLKTAATKHAFLDELTDLIAAAPVNLVSVVIDKAKYQSKHKSPANPYHLGLQYGLERVLAFLVKQGAQHTSHVIVECRGKNEDKDLELEFRRICDQPVFKTSTPDFEIVFADKKSNAIGLQLADLMARPVGMSVLKPHQSNRAMDVIRTKLIAEDSTNAGCGLKLFP
jgi:Protein of unknown function (DUF3800)